jgi:hypothetical protein
VLERPPSWPRRRFVTDVRQSEQAIGKMSPGSKGNPSAPAPFLATKVWTRGKDEGILR